MADSNDHFNLVPTTVATAASKRRNATTPPPQRSAKRVRSGGAAVPGGRPAVAKPIVVDNLDEEDAIIYDMKNRGFKDDRIAKHIKDRGGIVYAEKTISTRYTRIRRAMRKMDEQKADLEFEDFTEQHDGWLLEVFDEARDELQPELELLHATLLEKVFDKMKSKTVIAKYSRKVLEARYHDLVNGTAIVPPELDDNLDQRLMEAAQRFTERHLVRDWAEDQARFEKEDKERRTSEEERAAAEAKIKREEVKELTKAEKELAKIKKEADAEEREAKRQEKEQQRLMVKMEKEREIEAEKVEQEKKRKELAKKRREQKESKEARAVEKKLEAAERLRAEQAEKLKAIRNKNICRDVLFETMKRVPKVEEANDADMLATEPETPVPKSKYSKEDKISAEKAANPRMLMELDDLRALAKSRKLSSNGPKEEIVQRLSDAESKLSVPKLQDLLASRGLKKGGMKMELLRRLAAADAGKLVAPAKSVGNATSKQSSGKKSSAQKAKHKSTEEMTNDIESDVDGAAEAEVVDACYNE